MYTVSLKYVLPGGKRVPWSGQVSSKNKAIITKEVKEKTGENILYVVDVNI